MASVVDRLIAEHQRLDRLVRLLDSRSISAESATESNAALLVDALHERAAAFYRLYGFRQTADNAMTLYLPLGKG